MKKSIIYFTLLLVAVCFCTYGYAQSSIWRDVYKVKKKDNVYDIATRYGITVPELMKANPDMSIPGYELKKGDYIFIPYSANGKKGKSPKKDKKKDSSEWTSPITVDGTASVGNVMPAKQIPVSASTQTQNLLPSNSSSNLVDIRKRAIDVGVMLPLHDENGDGKRMVEYYRGMLMAIDSLKSIGISANVHAWNVPADVDIRTILLEPEVKKCDIIFGPLYSSQVTYLADFCRNNNIKLVVPFSIMGNDVKTNRSIYEVYQSPKRLNDDAMNAYFTRFPYAHAVFVNCNDTTSKKGVFTTGLRNLMTEKGVHFSITNIKSDAKDFAMAFSKTQQNVIILNTGRSPELNTVFAKLNALTEANPNLKISLYGYTEWLMYTHVYQALYNKYDVYIPSTFYYNKLSQCVNNLESQYRYWFKTDMQQALPRFGITGYDHASFFLRGIHEYGDKFTATSAENKYNSIQTPLNFIKVGAGGGYENVSFILIHYKKNGTLETITY